MKWHAIAAARLLVLAISCLGLSSVFSGCGSEATFGGPVLRKLNIPGVSEPAKKEEAVTIVDDQTVTDTDSPDEGAPEGVTETGGVTETETGGVGTEDATARRSLQWQLPCDGTSPSTTAAKLVGYAQHSVDARGSVVDVTVDGEVCEPAMMPRDVIFVVDVSDSMRGFFNGGNDPLRSSSCGRLDAVTAVATSLADNARIAFVTFDGNLEESLDEFIEPSDFLQNYAKADIFCFRGANTNFRNGLAKALDLLSDARPESAREVYFISDGESSSDATVGRAEAANIRSQATLATLMLRGDDSILKNELASQINGVPLHVKVSEAEALADAMSALADRELQSTIMTLGDQAIEIDVGEANFKLKAISVDPGAWPDGWPVRFESVDSFGNVWVQEGSIDWK